MRAWLLGLAAAACACHSAGYVQDAGADDGAAGSDGACACAVPGAEGGTIACGQVECVQGTSALCSAGSLIALGSCGDGGGGDASEGGACVPQCNNHNCGADDQCGGVCHCPPGLPCNANQTCGNGCDLTGQQPCVVGSTSAASCCMDGYSCKARDGGPALCCVVSGTSGQCGQSTDCCDYPQAQCDTFTSTCN
jgi:hypothetical protein